MFSNIKINNRIAYIFLIAVTVNLHLIRNLTPLYLLILGLLFMIGLIQFPYKLKFNGNKLSTYLLLIFFTCLIYTFGISLIYISPSELINGTPRLFITPLMCLILSMYVKNESDFKLLIKIFIVITLISCFTVFYQINYGKISWFTGRGFRGGLERYSSLQGSLTILGITSVQALNLIIFSNYKKIIKFISSFICLLGAIFSLQKAAVASILVVIIFIFINTKNKIRYSLSFFSVIYLLVILIKTLPSSNVISLYLNAILLNSIGFEISSTANVISDSPPISLEIIMDRILEYIYPYFNNYGFYNISIFGIGLKGGGSGMGVLGDQPHNSLYDLYLMGGIIFFIIGLLLVGYSIIFFLKKKSYLTKLFLYNNIMFLINIPFTSAGFFHPNISFIFWVSISYIIYDSKKKIMLT